MPDKLANGSNGFRGFASCARRAEPSRLIGSTTLIGRGGGRSWSKEAPLVLFGDVSARWEGGDDAIAPNTGDVDDVSRPGTLTMSSNEAESIVSPSSDERADPTDSASESS